MRVLGILFFTVCLLSPFAVDADVLDNFEYADDAAIKAAYVEISDGGQSATAALTTTDPGEGSKSGEIALSFGGTAWLSGALEYSLGTPLDLTAYNLIKLKVKGHANFPAWGSSLIIKFIDGAGEKILYEDQSVLESTTWTSLEIPLASFIEDPYDGSAGAADKTNIVYWQFYFQNRAGTTFTATAVLDAFEAIYQSLPGDGRYANIAIDGAFTDWLSGDQIDVAPNEVESSGDGDPDIVDIWVANDEDYMYVSVLLNNPINNIVYLFIDADMNTGTGLTWGWWASGGEKLCQLALEATGASYFSHDLSGSGWTWVWDSDATYGTDLQWGTQSAANDRVEVRLARAWLDDATEGNQSRIVVGTEGSGDYAPTSLGSQTYTYTYAAGTAVEDWRKY